MLNKDQYNQEEYNDYYRQETEGAELGGSTDKEGGLVGKLIMLLIFLALAIAGYFGYKAMNNSVTTDEIDTSLQVSTESSLPQTVQEEPEEPSVIEEKITPINVAQKVVETEKVESKKVETKVVQVEKPTSIQSTVPNEVTKAVSAQGKMSPEEVAAVVAAVMKQMNQQKSSDTSNESESVKNDAVLMDELSSSEVDSVSSDLIKELEGVDISEHKKIDNSKKQVDVYNKVNVQNVSGVDTLSQLSDQINSVMNEGTSKNKKDKTASYTDSLKSEVDVRKNEMRIIVVRRGDTLGKIAKRAYGNVMEFQKIYRANPEVTRPDRIYIGQKLRIPN